MTPEQFLARVIVPAAQLLPAHDSPEARCLLLAIAGQESGWSQRLQEPRPYARGFWQAEKTGQVLGVLTHSASRETIDQVLATLAIPPSLDTVYEATAWCDALAYWIARGGLLCDPTPIPAIGATVESWDCYLRNWRPGKPRPEAWPAIYSASAALFAPA